MRSGRLLVPPNLNSWLPQRLEANRFRVLSISLNHAMAVEDLPPYHGNPFDRRLIAPAVADTLTIVTTDPVFESDEVALLRC